MTRWTSDQTMLEFMCIIMTSAKIVVDFIVVRQQRGYRQIFLLMLWLIAVATEYAHFVLMLRSGRNFAEDLASIKRATVVTSSIITFCILKFNPERREGDSPEAYSVAGLIIKVMFYAIYEARRYVFI